MCSGLFVNRFVFLHIYYYFLFYVLVYFVLFIGWSGVIMSRLPCIVLVVIFVPMIRVLFCIERVMSELGFCLLVEIVLARGGGVRVCTPRHRCMPSKSLVSACAQDTNSAVNAAFLTRTTPLENKLEVNKLEIIKF